MSIMSRSQRTFSRRSFLKTTAAGVAIGVTTPFIMSRAAVGVGSDAFAPSPGFQRMFPTLKPAQFGSSDLAKLALGDGDKLIGMSSDPELLLDKDKKPRQDGNGQPIFSATPETEADDEENFGIPAGYTYLGQFIDHDLTRNPVEDFGAGIDASKIANMRTARFDLDSLYGAGIESQPYLYEPDGRRLVVGRMLNRMGQAINRHDVPRLNSRALIGDKRNDETVIISQLHAAFVAFHNRVADDRPKASLEELQQIVRQHYQWIVLTDFLPRIVGKETVAAVLGEFGEDGVTGRAPLPKATWTAGLVAGMIPMEFSDAAYRFGHSMIRPIYRLNARMHGSDEERRANPAIAGRRFIFAASPYAGLNGFREFPAEWAIDWNLFYEIDARLDVARVKDGLKRVQPSYKLDTSLVNPLAFLPEFSAPLKGAELQRDADGHPRPADGKVSNLALRNLLRASQHGLPSGQDVARALGFDPIADDDLRIGKANLDGLETNQPITAFGDSFRGAAPLWTYVLAEAQHLWTLKARATAGNEDERNAIPTRLGPVGGRLVAEAFVALMKLDPASIINAGPDWRPTYAINGRFAMPELLKTAAIA